ISYLAPQDGDLTREGGVLCRKPALRPKGRGGQRQQKTDEREHGSLTVGDSPAKATRTKLSVHSGSHREKADKDGAICPNRCARRSRSFCVATDKLEDKKHKFRGWKSPKTGERQIDDAATNSRSQ